MISIKLLRLLFCLVVFGGLTSLTVAYASAAAGALNTSVRVGKVSANPTVKNSLGVKTTGKLASKTPLLRLKLYIDEYNYDDIAIGFNSGASQLYNPNEDSRYMEGLDAPEGLSCYSSDGIPLSVDLLPLPNQTQEIIRLDIQAQNSGQITLERNELDSIPPIYEIWLVDNYKKDSLDLRANDAYKFSINKADSGTFGSNRFYVVIRQNPALGVHLLGFTAIKASNGVQIGWTTENEENYTKFSVEKSTAGDVTFNSVDTLTSSAKGTYNYVDKVEPVAAEQYRLMMRDLNGTVSYSDTITLLYSNGNSITATDISIYPNPVSSVINLAINKNSSGPSTTPVSQSLSQGPSFDVNTSDGASAYGIKIINITGNVIKTATSSKPAWQCNVSSFPPGTYIIQVVNFGNNSLVGRSTFIKL